MVAVNEEFSLGSNTYRIVRISAMAAFDIARTLGPVLEWMGKLLADKPDATREAVVRAFCGSMGMLARKDAMDAVYGCLAAVTRRQPSGWAGVCNGGNLVFDDITMPEMLELAWSVLEANGILSFFGGAPSVSPDNGAR
jgi:hypothetical protein